MKFKPLDIESTGLDVVFCSWLGNNISRTDRNKWKAILAHNPQAREAFCQWLKSLRGPPDLLKKPQSRTVE